MGKPTPIFLHQYRITAMESKRRDGLQQITLIVQTEVNENQHFEAVDEALKMLDGTDIHVEHTLLLSGYKQNVE